jgi:uncharacterized repeat protein (TIGR03803 family)
MTHGSDPRFTIHLPLMCLLVLALASPASAEWKEKALYSFQGGTTDGAVPAGGVVFDAAGNLYGATSDGGAACPSPGCGVAFQFARPATQGDPWTETVLHAFSGNGNGDGATPAGGLSIDSAGNLYGTTGYGGTGNCVLLGSKTGCGVVYELVPPKSKGGQWTEKILYSFQGGKDGDFPAGNLTFDKAGNLYGATQYGGGFGSCNAPYFQNCGVVFKLSPPEKKGGKWREKALYSFKGVKSGEQEGDGANPNGGLVLDSNGAIYGTTYFGGNNQKGSCEGGVGGTGCGIVFKLDPPGQTGGKWTEKPLHRFDGSQDGDNPSAGLTSDKKSNLYGTTLTGGPNGGGGTVFRLTPPSKESGAWKKEILYGFNGTGGGLDAESPVIFDSIGNLYGTTLDSGATYHGTVFRLRPPKQEGGTWTSSLLYGFQGPPDGGQPAAGLAFDESGNLYSTTTQGGSGTGCSFHGCGTVFEVSQ